MEEYMGIIKIFAGSFPPREWAFCNGQLLTINQNEALFSILGSTYGGDGRTTFALPDLRGRAPIHSGNDAPGLGLTSIGVGEETGSETTILSIQNLPAHNHDITVSETTGTLDIPVNTDAGGEDEANPGAGFLVNTGADSFSSESTAGQKYGGQSLPVNIAATAAASMTGNTSAFSNMQPSIGVNYIICLNGLYPPRS